MPTPVNNSVALADIVSDVESGSRNIGKPNRDDYWNCQDSQQFFQSGALTLVTNTDTSFFIRIVATHKTYIFTNAVNLTPLRFV